MWDRTAESSSLRAGGGIGDGSDSHPAPLALLLEIPKIQPMEGHPVILSNLHLPGKHFLRGTPTTGQGLLLTSGIRGKPTPIPDPPDSTCKGGVCVHLSREAYGFHHSQRISDSGNLRTIS